MSRMWFKKAYARAKKTPKKHDKDKSRGWCHQQTNEPHHGIECLVGKKQVTHFEIGKHEKWLNYSSPGRAKHGKPV